MGIIFFLIGIAAVALGIWMRYKTLQALSWPAVDGEIIRSEVESDSDGDSSPRVTYRYQVGKKFYESSQISFVGHSASSSAARALVERYPLNSRVQVYYDPDSPKSAVIEREPNNIWIGVIATGAVFAIIAFLF